MLLREKCLRILKRMRKNGGGVQAGNLNRGGRLSTVDLLIKVACFKKGK